MKTKLVLINDLKVIQQVEKEIQKEHKTSLRKAQREIEIMFKKTQYNKVKRTLCEDSIEIF